MLSFINCSDNNDCVSCSSSAEQNENNDRKNLLLWALIFFMISILLFVFGMILLGS